MNLPEYSVHRPVTILMFYLGVTMIGSVLLMRLPVDLLPDVERKSVAVVTKYEGAGPEEIETLVTEPIEREVSTASNVIEVVSDSREDQSRIDVKFAWGADMNEALNEVREKVAIAKRRTSFPEDAEEPIVYKFEWSMIPILRFGLSGQARLDRIRKYADDEIQYRIEQLEGVASVSIEGGLEREILIEVNRSAIEALAMTPTQLIDILSAENLDLPGGYVESDSTEFLLRTKGQFAAVREMEDAVIAERGGVPIRLRNVARVLDTFKEVRYVTRMMEGPGVTVSVYKQSGENTPRVAARVRKKLREIRKNLPPGIEMELIFDESDFIRNSISQVSATATQGGALAILVLLFFLRSLRSTLIVAVSIPLSVVATFILMGLGGISLNMVSLGGLALGIGMLVDNSIVVLENIFRHRELGEDAQTASVRGSDEVRTAITASTLTTLCVFVPLLLLSGTMAAAFFREMALTVSFSLAASLVVALTLVPMLSARLLRLGKVAEHSRLFRASERAFAYVEKRYGDALAALMTKRLLLSVAVVLALACSFLAMPKLGTEFMPNIDEGQISLTLELPIGTRLEITDRVMREIEETVKTEVPEMRSIYAQAGTGASHGGRASTGTHTGTMNLTLVSRADRQRGVAEIVAALRKRLVGIPGAKIWIFERGSLLARVIGGGQSEQVQIEVRGHDLRQGVDIARRIAEAVTPVRGVRTPRLSQELGKPELVIHVDRRKASALGVNVSDVANVVRTCFVGTVATRYREGGDEYDVRIRLREEDRLKPVDISKVMIRSRSGAKIPLRNIVTVDEEAGPVKIDRKNRERIVTVSASIEDRDLGSVIADIRKAIAGIPTGEGVSISFAGDTEEAQKSSHDIIIVLLLAVSLVYMVMASQFESLLHPFIIMFTIPFSLIGVVMTLYYTNTYVGVMAAIGVVLLCGIVVNNAIVMIDYVNQLRARGMEMRQAVIEGSRTRLRPILMTTLTTVLALIPLSMGIGEGAELQAPLGRVVVGGLTVSTLLTLFFIPALYTAFEDGRSWVLRLRQRATSETS